MLKVLWTVGVSFNNRNIENLIFPFIVLLAFGILVILPVILLKKWYFSRRRIKKRIITAEYHPPLNLTPTEISFIFDRKFRERHIGATIIHMAQRGIIHIRKVDGIKHIYAGPKIEDNLKNYEKYILDHIEEGTGVPVYKFLDTRLDYSESYSGKTVKFKVFNICQLVHKDLRKKGYVKDNHRSRFFIFSFKISLLIILLAIWLPFYSLWLISILTVGSSSTSDFLDIFKFSYVTSTIYFIPLYMIACLITYIRSRITGREWIITNKLKRMWPQIIGFRQFVKLSEKNKLDFYNQSLKKHSKLDLLPYAIALGFVKNWKELIT